MEVKEISLHPKWGNEFDNLCYIHKDVTKLIIGSMPPYRFCKPHKKLDLNDVDFFYGSYDNVFWKYIEEVNNIVFSTTKDGDLERKRWLKDNKIGMVDMIKTCYHKNKSSLDKDLEPIEIIDLQSILKKYSNVTLIYTSRYIVSLVHKSLNSYHKWTDKKHGYITIGEVKYPVVVLSSPSKNALRRIKRDNIVKEYEKFFKSN